VCSEQWINCRAHDFYTVGGSVAMAYLNRLKNDWKRSLTDEKYEVDVVTQSIRDKRKIRTLHATAVDLRDGLGMILMCC
jgi:hypothetical protein